MKAFFLHALLGFTALALTCSSPGVPVFTLDEQVEGCAAILEITILEANVSTKDKSIERAICKAAVVSVLKGDKGLKEIEFEFVPEDGFAPPRLPIIVGQTYLLFFAIREGRYRVFEPAGFNLAEKSRELAKQIRKELAKLQLKFVSYDTESDGSYRLQVNGLEVRVPSIYYPEQDHTVRGTNYQVAEFQRSDRYTGGNGGRLSGQRTDISELVLIHTRTGRKITLVLGVSVDIAKPDQPGPQLGPPSLSPPGARAAEPFFRKGDVIALVGGEDMVVASEYGYLELLLTRALPGHHLRFRNLAWEGDTVFEQRRDLNFPTWEEQLDKIGATVVIAQFGQMESLAGKEKLPEFIAAYEKLLARFSAGGKRRVVVLAPFGVLQSLPFFGNEPAEFAVHAKQLGDNPFAAFNDYLTAIRQKYLPRLDTALGDSRSRSINFLDVSDVGVDAVVQREGIHLNELGHLLFAHSFPLALSPLGGPAAWTYDWGTDRQLLSVIQAKNRLWFDYWRVQNWAFLAGDRTNQPSSRDHLDPAKRWFPAEREAFLPLIEAKEKEIDALAQQLAQP